MRNRGWPVLTLVVAIAASPAAQKPPPADEVVTIDGSRNPELIPQWSAWEFAFRVIAGGPKELPTDVHRVVSREERARVMAAAEADRQRDAACRERISKLLPLLRTAKASVINARQADIQLDCRSQTLRIRDRLLEQLPLEGQAALIAFVESLKAGTSVTVTKRELPHFQKPQ
jgi:hypothetical protein